METKKSQISFIDPSEKVIRVNCPKANYLSGLYVMSRGRPYERFLPPEYILSDDHSVRLGRIFYCGSGWVIRGATYESVALNIHTDGVPKEGWSGRGTQCSDGTTCEEIPSLEVEKKDLLKRSKSPAYREMARARKECLREFFQDAPEFDHIIWVLFQYCGPMVSRIDKICQVCGTLVKFDISYEEAEEQLASLNAQIKKFEGKKNAKKRKNIRKQIRRFSKNVCMQHPEPSQIERTEKIDDNEYELTLFYPCCEKREYVIASLQLEHRNSRCMFPYRYFSEEFFQINGKKYYRLKPDNQPFYYSQQPKWYQKRSKYKKLIGCTMCSHRF